MVDRLCLCRAGEQDHLGGLLILGRDRNHGRHKPRPQVDRAERLAAPAELHIPSRLQTAPAVLQLRSRPIGRRQIRAQLRPKGRMRIGVDFLQRGPRSL